MLTLIKIGGSLITDKTSERTFRAEAMQAVAVEIQRVLQATPDQQMVIGHGSGSFGHYAARRHGTAEGVVTREDWLGFAQVAAAAYELSHYVLTSLRHQGIPAWRLQPSASALARDGQVTEMALHPLQTALANGLVPLIHGDVAIDAVRGGTILSTEAIFDYLTQQLPVDRIILLGEVEGVLSAEGTVIPAIHPGNFEHVAAAIGGSRGVDVTGGMYTKVQRMLDLTQQIEGLSVHIIDGRKPIGLYELMVYNRHIGTRIHG